MGAAGSIAEFAGPCALSTLSGPIPIRWAPIADPSLACPRIVLCISDRPFISLSTRIPSPPRCSASWSSAMLFCSPAEVFEGLGDGDPQAVRLNDADRRTALKAGFRRLLEREVMNSSFSRKCGKDRSLATVCHEAARVSGRYRIGSRATEARMRRVGKHLVTAAAFSESFLKFRKASNRLGCKQNNRAHCS